MLTQCEASVSTDNVHRWMLKCIKRHGGPYEIPEKCKQTWTLMKEFLEENVFDSKISESKRKACILQGLLSCCLTMESSLRRKVEEIAQLQNAVDNSNKVCERLQNQSETETVNLKLHAVTIGEALLEKSKRCDELSEENERLKLRIMELEKRSQECRYASNLGFCNLHQNTNSKFLSNETEPHVKSDNSLPAAPNITTKIYNNNNSTGEVQIMMKPLKPKELDVILKEIGTVPCHDLNIFLKWVCDVQNARDMYNLNPSDLERVLQHSIGNGLWMRIKQICIQPLSTRDILLELLCVLYGVRSDVTIHGKVQQLQTESPYQLSHRIATIMEILGGNNLAFERGGLVHTSMVLDALHENIKQNILFVTPNPHDLSDILLRADHLWRKSKPKGDLATMFRQDSGQDNVSHSSRAQRKAHGRPALRCFVCQRFGHIARYCFAGNSSKQRNSHYPRTTPRHNKVYSARWGNSPRHVGHNRHNQVSFKTQMSRLRSENSQLKQERHQFMENLQELKMQMASFTERYQTGVNL